MDESRDHLADSDCAFCTGDYPLEFAELILSASSLAGVTISPDKFSEILGEDLKGCRENRIHGKWFS